MEWYDSGIGFAIPAEDIQRVLPRLMKGEDLRPGLLGISLKPSTVIIASMALVIADDDTLQFLLRFKRRYLALQGDGLPAPHRRAALDTLAECGRAMAVTTAAVSAGFARLRFSRFEGIANLGLLTALTLWAAGLADAFLTPVLLLALRPELKARSWR